ncbi:hypothetical protein FOA52_004689 [Chlamydomonas sp. UWO 241]|nr:hypothetical protein FOA52_004689 [Chlamydomonas sp. UWO 241]
MLGQGTKHLQVHRRFNVGQAGTSSAAPAGGVPRPPPALSCTADTKRKTGGASASGRGPERNPDTRGY